MNRAWPWMKLATPWVAILALFLDDTLLGGPCLSIDCDGERDPMATTIFLLAAAVLALCCLWWVASALRQWMDGEPLD